MRPWRRASGPQTLPLVRAAREAALGRLPATLNAKPLRRRVT
jgi:hypothetical protein